MFKSTKGVSKQRRSLINAELLQLRELVPVSETTRNKLSQLQVMSLTCVYIRKSFYFEKTLVPVYYLGNKNGCPEAPDTYGETELFKQVVGPCTTENNSMAANSWDFFQALPGFILVTTRSGKLLYISENVTEYLGHSMMDIFTQGDSVYDIVDRRDHVTVRQNLFANHNQVKSSGSALGCRSSNHFSGVSMTTSADTLSSPIKTRSSNLNDSNVGAAGCDWLGDDLLNSDWLQNERVFLCRMNVARGCRRQTGLAEHKMMHVRGHFIHLPEPPGGWGPLSQAGGSLDEDVGSPRSEASPLEEEVFVAVCSPLVGPHDRLDRQAHQHNTLVYKTVHRLDMSYLDVSSNGLIHLGYSLEELVGTSWYTLMHPLEIQQAANKHVQLLKSSHEVGCSFTIHLLTKSNQWLWLNVLMVVNQSASSSQINGSEVIEPSIVCINHVICESSVHPYETNRSAGQGHQIWQHAKCKPCYNIFDERKEFVENCTYYNCNDCQAQYTELNGIAPLRKWYTMSSENSVSLGNGENYQASDQEFQARDFQRDSLGPDLEHTSNQTNKYSMNQNRIGSMTHFQENSEERQQDNSMYPPNTRSVITHTQEYAMSQSLGNNNNSNNNNNNNNNNIVVPNSYTNKDYQHRNQNSEILNSNIKVGKKRRKTTIATAENLKNVKENIVANSEHDLDYNEIDSLKFKLQNTCQYANQYEGEKYYNDYYSFIGYNNRMCEQFIGQQPANHNASGYPTVITCCYGDVDKQNVNNPSEEIYNNHIDEYKLPQSDQTLKHISSEKLNTYQTTYHTNLEDYEPTVQGYQQYSNNYSGVNSAEIADEYGSLTPGGQFSNNWYGVAFGFQDYMMEQCLATSE